MENFRKNTLNMFFICFHRNNNKQSVSLREKKRKKKKEEERKEAAQFDLLARVSARKSLPLLI